MPDKMWRLIENEWNLKSAPWTGAVGIEEIDDEAAVPSVICWFTRGGSDKRALAQSVVDAHNFGVMWSLTDKLSIDLTA